jgi:alcohol dehydrogenase
MADFDPDIVIAIGGGSVMDAAKFMSVIARHGGTVMDYIRGRAPPDGGYPLYAIPTTPGTSSEITPYSIVTLDELNNKVGLRHPSIYPKGAVIDPKLTISLPEEQTAATGLDILSHAVESYWASRSDPLTREMSIKSVRLVKEHLLDAYRDGSARKHREGVSLASVFAGLAFSNTGTTVCHSISYPVTYDTGLPHGIAVAITIGPAFDLLQSVGVEGLDRLAKAFGSDVSSFSHDLKKLLSDLNVPKTFQEAGFRGGLDRIMSTDLTPLMKNMPASLSEEEIESILESVL